MAGCRLSKPFGKLRTFSRNPLARGDEAANGLRERQHRPGSEKLFKLVAILPGQTFGGSPVGQPPRVPSAFSQVFARVGRAAKRGVKESNTGGQIHHRRQIGLPAAPGAR